MLQMRLCKDEYFFNKKYKFMTQWINLEDIKIKYLNDFIDLLNFYLENGSYIEYRTI